MAFQLAFQVIFLLCSLNPFLAEAQSMTKGGCKERCGNITIPYPFGMETGCYLEERFRIDCNSSSIPTLDLNGTSLEVKDISVDTANNIIQINFPFIFQNCSSKTSSRDSLVVNLEDTPFSFSTENRFVAVGCNNLALLSRNEATVGGCMSICNVSSSDASANGTICNGINCCETTIPSGLDFFNATLQVVGDKVKDGCKYAYLVDQNWFNLRFDNNISVMDMDYVPVVLNWRIDLGLYENMTLNGSAYSVTNLTSSGTSRCSQNSTFLLCSCFSGFQGNPYIPDGCQDINECQSSSINNTTICSSGLICQNLYGGHQCVKLEIKKSRVKMVGLGFGVGFGVLVLLIGSWWLYRVIKKSRNEKRKKMFFQRNGGLLLQEQLSSGEVNVEKIKLFGSKELDKATDHYNVNRTLGQGGQGTVYKGMLADGKIIAVKKSKVLDEDNLRQFINEVVILSQINHRNVVKLFGCCLETEVPLLVYEFIPNGTLYQFLHDSNEEFPLTWEMRLRIATEVSGALSYLHSAASIPIFHRDIKSTNILLDEKYRAKVADFGTSKSVTIDQTRVTTLVLGTFGYLDPEYFQTSQLTAKSDVYSFGVVLAELLTGQKPISAMRSEEENRSLVTYFIVSMEENHLFDILDPQVTLQGKKEDVMMVAMLAKRCLSMKGRERPTMKEVAMVLEGIQKSYGTQKSQHMIIPQEIEYDPNGFMEGLWDLAASDTTGSSSDSRLASSLDRKPLLINIK